MSGVLAFPALLRCHRCAHFTVDAEGAPVCMEWEEPIADETVAEFCPEFEALT